jgi:predicted RNA-binding Zn ribbon-like protein
MFASNALPEPIGGRLCLDFANTAEGRRGAIFGEYLGTYSRLVAWAELAGVLSSAQSSALLHLAERDPRASSAAYREAVALRETIYRVFATLAADASRSGAVAADVDTLRRVEVDALAAGRLVRQGSEFGWTWAEPAAPDDLRRMLWPLAHSAIELLTSPDVARVKECPGGGNTPCSWLFVDLSKNGIRRWCRMSECGSIAKARRQTTRRRDARAQRGP